jgi:hypothetical protein
MEARPFLKQPKPLTFDERRAAEAAFAGEPPSMEWSQAGFQVYQGLTAALLSRAAQTLAACR